MVKIEKIGEGRYLLDVRGYVCPYPVIYTRKALSNLRSDEVLEVITDNPPSCENVPRAVRDEGNEIKSVDRVEEGVWKIVIVKKR